MAEVLPPEPAWETPILFFAALHLLALRGDADVLAAAYRGDGELWPAAEDALREHRAFVAEFVREQAVQTNEVGRCWALVPGFLTAASGHDGSVDLLELGPSAGLNLCWHLYGYRYEDVRWGPSSPLVLSGRWEGPLPRELFGVGLAVRRRVGVDRSPVDATTEEGALLLQAFLWADQPQRVERMRAAIDVLRRDPPELVAGDYVELLPELLAEADPSALTIVFDSVSTQYVDDDGYSAIEAALAAAGRRIPLAWVSMEPPRGSYHPFFVDVRRWPGGEPKRLAEVHYHAEWLRWLAAAT